MKEHQDVRLQRPLVRLVDDDHAVPTHEGHYRPLLGERAVHHRLAQQHAVRDELDVCGSRSCSRRNARSSPTSSPSTAPRSSATRFATVMAATRRGCVMPMTPSLRITWRCESHLKNPDSCRYCAIWVVLPLPVSPTIIVVRVPLHRLDDLLAVGVHGQTLPLLLELRLTKITRHAPPGSSFVPFDFGRISHCRPRPR